MWSSTTFRGISLILNICIWDFFAQIYYRRKSICRKCLARGFRTKAKAEQNEFFWKSEKIAQILRNIAEGICAGIERFSIDGGFVGNGRARAVDRNAFKLIGVFQRFCWLSLKRQASRERLGQWKKRVWREKEKRRRRGETGAGNIQKAFRNG